MMGSPLHTQLSPEKFYWALLDATLLPSRPTCEQLGYLFESVLPCPIEDVHASYARLPEKRILACGMRREALRAECGNSLTLTPARLPDFIDCDVDPQRLNLLTGEFEPKPVTRLRRSWWTQAAALLLAFALILTLGFELRARDYRQHAQGLHHARSVIYEQVLDSPGPSHMPPQLRLTAELRQLRQTRARPPVSGAEVTTGDKNVAGTLALLLANWPSEADSVHLQTEHLSITPSAITLRGLLPTSADAQRLAEGFRRMDGWQLQQPQVTSSRDNVQAVLRLAPQKEASQ